jgi:hypothetical protein
MLACRELVASFQNNFVRGAMAVVHNPIDPRHQNLFPRLVQLLGGI